MNPRDVSCESVRALLALVPGNDLPRRDDPAVRQHLASCSGCRQELGAYLRARRALRTLTPEPGTLPPDFFPDLRDETLAAVRADRGRRERVGVRRRSMAGIMTAAALFLLGVYLVPLPRPTIPEGPLFEPGLPRALPSTSPYRDLGYRDEFIGFGLSGHRPVNFRRVTLVLPDDMMPDADSPAGSESSNGRSDRR